MITVKKFKNLSVKISTGKLDLLADVDAGKGGDESGFDPHQLLEASLGACTNITVMMYANMKQWPLEDIQTEVTITKEKDENIIQRKIKLIGDLDETQKKRLIDIANKCPIHNFLERKTTVETSAND